MKISRTIRMAIAMAVATLLAGSLAGCGASSVDSAAAPPPGGGPSAYAGSAESRAAVASMADALAASNTAGSPTYKVGPVDVLDITVFQVPEMSKVVQVSEAGTINYPLLGEVYVAGKSPREIEQLLTKGLGQKYLKDPQVTVFVREYNSQRVTIQGSVNKPGIYPIQGGLTLLQLIALAGGMDTSSSDDSVVIFRTTDGRRSAARYEIGALQSGTAADPQLQAGDMVVAGRSALKEGVSTIIKALPLAAVFTWF